MDALSCDHIDFAVSSDSVRTKDRYESDNKVT